VNGAVTNRISATAMVGYGASLYDQGDDGEAVYGLLRGIWKATETLNATLSYTHSISNTFVGNFYTRHSFNLGTQGMFDGRFLLGVDGGLSFLSFGTPVTRDGMPLGMNSDGSFERDDVLVTGKLFGEYR